MIFSADQMRSNVAWSQVLQRSRPTDDRSSPLKTSSGKLTLEHQFRQPTRGGPIMHQIRMQRVNEAVKEVVSQTIVEELEDPRIGFVTVTKVQTSNDMKRAKIFVSIMGNEETKVQTLEGLASSHGLIQSRIASELKMKNTPTINFVYDETVDTMFRIDELLKRSK